MIINLLLLITFEIGQCVTLLLPIQHGSTSGYRTNISSLKPSFSSPGSLQTVVTHTLINSVNSHAISDSIVGTISKSDRNTLQISHRFSDLYGIHPSTPLSVLSFNSSKITSKHSGPTSSLFVKQYRPSTSSTESRYVTSKSILSDSTVSNESQSVVVSTYVAASDSWHLSELSSTNVLSSLLSTSVPYAILPTRSSLSVMPTSSAKSRDQRSNTLTGHQLSITSHSHTRPNAILPHTTHIIAPTSSQSSTSAIMFSLVPPLYSVLIPTPSMKNATTFHQTGLPVCAYTRTCCSHGLNQVPVSLTFEESLQRGSTLLEMQDMWNVSLDVRIASPQQLQKVLHDYFSVLNTGNTYRLVLRREVDIEELYILMKKKMDVHHFQLQFNCLENGQLFPSRVINVTIDDVDDNMPVFQHDGTGPNCVVPVYTADTSEDYMGELEVHPGKIKAVDGDLTKKNSITYRVMHAEPNDYHEYFYVDVIDGTVNKTKQMNASNSNKYVLFVEATEDSPQQKKRVAILSIDVYAPLGPNEEPTTVDPQVKYALQIISALVLIAFAAGFFVLIHHRYRRHQLRVDPKLSTDDEALDVRLPKLAVYKSSTSSLNSTIPDIPIITSPSQVAIKPKQKVLTKSKTLIVKKPLDTRSRPGWNMPSQKGKRVTYNPHKTLQTIKP